MTKTNPMGTHNLGILSELLEQMDSDNFMKIGLLRRFALLFASGQSMSTLFQRRKTYRILKNFCEGYQALVLQKTQLLSSHVIQPDCGDDLISEEQKTSKDRKDALRSLKLQISEELMCYRSGLRILTVLLVAAHCASEVKMGEGRSSTSIDEEEGWPKKIQKAAIRVRRRFCTQVVDGMIRDSLKIKRAVARGILPPEKLQCFYPEQIKFHHQNFVRDQLSFVSQSDIRQIKSIFDERKTYYSGGLGWMGSWGCKLRACFFFLIQGEFSDDYGVSSAWARCREAVAFLDAADKQEIEVFVLRQIRLLAALYGLSVSLPSTHPFNKQYLEPILGMAFRKGWECMQEGKTLQFLVAQVSDESEVQNGENGFRGKPIFKAEPLQPLSTISHLHAGMIP